MESISDEKDTEEQSNIFVFPDSPLVRILSELSWTDMLKFQNDEEMSKFFQIFDTKNLCFLKIPVVGNVDIFNILSREFVIQNLCFPSTELKDVLPQLSSLSFNTIECFKIFECRGTKILPADFVTKLLTNIPNIMYVDIGSWNIGFFKSLFKKYFTMELSCKMKSKNDYDGIFLSLYFYGEFYHLLDFLRSNKCELGNVTEIPDDSDYPR
uniref:F-box domain-containing protein n=1 Tax=Strongyloides venezuelensis TaxID=75913 RepID=A0A0K0F5C3_STRVS